MLQAFCNSFLSDYASVTAFSVVLPGKHPSRQIYAAETVSGHRHYISFLPAYIPGDLQTQILFFLCKFHSLQVHISPTRAAFASFPNLNGISKVSIRFSLKNKIKSTTVFSDNAFHILIRERITQLKEQEGLSKLKRKLLPSKTSFF